MKRLIAVVMFGALAGLVLAETDYQVGKGVEKVVTRRLQVQGHNAAAIITGSLTVTGNETHTGDMTVVGDVDASGDVSGANVAVTGKVSGTAGSFTSMTGGTVAVTGAITAGGRIASQSASSGEVRLGYLTSDGWLFGTVNGGQTLSFLTDYANTGGVSRATLNSNGLFSASAVTISGAASLGGHVLLYRTLTNLVYDGGATTGNVNIVSW